MAKLQVVGTGSRQGNTYLLKTSAQTLILDLGCKWKDIFEMLNYEINDVVGAIVTHIHSDHSKSIPNALKYQLPVYSCRVVSDNFTGVIPLQPGKKYRIGKFVVHPFHVKHNVECYSYLIENEEIGRMLFVTDCVNFPYSLSNLNTMLIEANYSNDIIVNRICEGYDISSHNEHHMEINETIDCIKRNFNSELNHVILCHLSDGQSDEKKFQQMVYDEIGLWPIVANKGTEIELYKEDF